MSGEEVTASTLSKDQDMKEAEMPASSKKAAADIAKVEQDIESAKSLAKAGKIQEALEALLNLEKQSRLAEDVPCTTRCCLAVVDVCYESGDWKMLNENILLLSKRRAQLKQPVQAFVRQAMTYLSKTPDAQVKTELIKTLQAVTEGKIYVEIERARLTRQLAQMQEQDGKISEAADTLQEIAVETYGAMAKTEKIAFILEQVRLCLDRGDFIRAQILAKKVSPRAFRERPGVKGQAAGEIGIEGTTIEHPIEGTPSLEELKLIYYRSFIRYHSHHNNYLEICRCYRAIYESESIAADEAKWQPVLKRICWYVVLAATSPEQITLLETTAADKRLEQLPIYKELLQTFTTKEIVWWKTLETKLSNEVAAESEVFGGEDGSTRKTDIRQRVIEHNLLVIAQYYDVITFARLCELLDLSQEEAEKHLSRMVTDKALHARMDRPAGVVRFAARRQPDAVLNEWAGRISKLLEVVDRTCQQIQKESMVHKVPIGIQS
ncbi:hypothetical protein WJX84_011652 [Apatococcus fuscideae]|uniref:PCI domain-containing protein n=1 Tax=Apatococcus fuscideae TaxID=2026836 RepID=A0AAW1T3N8_9CHLO